MKKLNRLFIVLLALSIFTSSYAQKDNEVLLSVGDEKFTVGEFKYVFNKNNSEDKVIKKADVDEYLDLYINFRLKVKQAEDLGLDTLKSFVSELSGYRKQLAKPYLTDKSVTEELLKEAYERRKYAIRASHIMVAVPENVAENDKKSIEAIKKLKDIKSKIENGADFAEMAIEHSDDPSARDMPAQGNQPPRKGNGGDLGYFTAFYMVYPFENAAYNTEVGEISDVIRTQFGYHIIKVVDRIENPGKIHCAHINIKVDDFDNKQELAEKERKANEIYEQITNGDMSFEMAAKRFSDDRGSRDKGGELPIFEVNKMVPEFVEGVAKLDKDEVSKPVLTQYGFHIIKLLDNFEQKSYEDSKAELNRLVARDSRSNKSKSAALEAFKKEFSFKEYKKNLEKFYDCVDSSIFKRNWKAEYASNCKKNLFKLDGNKYTQQDFAKYLEKQQKKFGEGTKKYFINQTYDQWLSEIVFDYKDKMLEKQYPEFRMLMKEYHDGILLFNISDKKVWGKAVNDSTGLEAFYEENKQNYMWDERVHADVWSAKNDSIAAIAREMIKKGIPNDSIARTLNNNSSLNVSYQTSKFLDGANEFVDNANKKIGLSENIEKENVIIFVNVLEILPAQPKELSEARGLITADYQNQLEKEWMKELKSNYQVKVNKEILEKIKANYEE